ncbi:MULTISPECIES: amino acid adenylation domain-containing protein [unclassified Niallia]|uniref:amino acid adenylation domain-containing protein n=1 Tax=unclassified Niallia TaxID=2837522 RepID=UPI0030FCA973
MNFSHQVYWLNKLKSFELATKLIPDLISNKTEEAEYATIEAEVPKNLAESILKLGKYSPISIFIIGATLLKVLLQKFSGEENTVIGIPTYPSIDKTSFLPLFTEQKEETTFKEFLLQVKETILDAFKHQDISCQELVNLLMQENEIKIENLFHIIFKSQGLHGSKSIDIPIGTDVCIQLDESPNRMRLLATYNTKVYKEYSIKNFLDRWIFLAQNIIENPNIKCSDIKWMDEVEQKFILEKFYYENNSYPVNTPLHILFEQQVLKTPNSVAVIYGETVLTYDELNKKANKLSAKILEISSQKNEDNTFVGIYKERSTDFLVAMLAILKAGKAFIPIDPTYPEQRIQYMLTQSGCSIVIVDEYVRNNTEYLYEKLDSVIFISNQDTDLEDYPSDNLNYPISAKNPIYMMYTSGSTGLPKGAVLRHDGVINHIYAQFEYMNLHDDLVFLQSAPSSSDISVWQFLSPILIGGTTVIVDKNSLLNPNELFELIQLHKITVIEFVPQLLEMFVQHAMSQSNNTSILSSLQWIMATGETLSVSLLNMLLEFFPHTKIANAYGPTEASDDTMQYNTKERLTENEARVPIGKPLPNVRVHILDDKYMLVPIGAPGEIYISGIAVGKGYWLDDEKTRESFISDPYFPNQMMYKTGDAGRWLPTGDVEFLGRIDKQLKIRGFRIEPSDIEHEILKHHSIRQCVVVAQEKTNGDHMQLVAYLVIEESKEWDSSSFRKWLEHRLPQHMIPSQFIRIDSIPLTPSGKVDRVLLSNHQLLVEDKYKSKEIVQPRNKTEEILLEVWTEILPKKKIGIYDSFFDLGGDSIQSIQIVAKAKTRHINITPKDIFEHLTIENIAKIASRREDVTKMSEESDDPVLLTPIQKWFFELNLQNPHHFNQAVILNLDPRISFEMAKRVIHTIVKQHDALRMYFNEKDDVINVIEPSNELIEEESLLLVKDISELNSEEQKIVIEDYAAKLQTEINIFQPFVFKFAYIETGFGQPSRLVLIIHHLVVDGVSWRILINDIFTCFQQLLNNNRINLLPSSTSFAEWSRTLQQSFSVNRLELEVEYWEKIIKHSNKGKILFETPNVKYGKVREYTNFISQENTSRFLNIVPNFLKARIEEVILSVWIETLYKYFNINSILIDMEGHGRNLSMEEIDLTRTIGWFTSLYPLHIERKSNWDYFDLVQEIKMALSKVPQNGINFGLLRYMSKKHTLSTFHSSGIRFNYVGDLDSTLPSGKLLSISSESPGESIGKGNRTNYVLDVNLGINRGKIHYNFVYNDSFLSVHEIEKISEILISEIDIMTQYCETQQSYNYTILSIPQNDIKRNDIEQIVNSEFEIEDIYPVTPMQRAILFHNIFYANKGLNSQQIYWILEGDLQVEIFQKSWEKVINAHPILRTSFRWRKLKAPIQILYRRIPFDFEYIDWSMMDTTSHQSRINEFIDYERTKGINSTHLPLVRFKLIRLSTNEHFFMFTYSTSLFDNWSWRNIMNDVIETYDFLNMGVDVEITNQGKFVDYVKWFFSKNTDLSRLYWQNEFKSMKLFTTESLNLTSNQTFISGEIELEFSSEETNDAERIAKKYGITLNSLLQAVWAMTWCCYDNNHDVLYGILSSGRTSEVQNVDRISGPLSNFLPMRSKLKDEITVIDWIRNLQICQIEALQHDFVSPEQIAKWTHVNLDYIQQAIYERSFIFVGESDESYMNHIKHRSLNIRDISNTLTHNVPFRGYATKNRFILMSIKFDKKKYPTSKVELWLQNYKKLFNYVVNNINSNINLEQIIENHACFKKNINKEG